MAGNVGNLAGDLIDLLGKLARGGDDEHHGAAAVALGLLGTATAVAAATLAHGLGRSNVLQVVHGRQQEGGRLAGAGLSGGKQVAALEHHGDGASRQAWAPCSPGSRWHEASRPKGPARQRQAGSRSRTRRSRRRWPRRQHRRQLWVMASRASSRISASVTSDTELRICCCSLSARVMGTACGRASVLGSALIHTKTGAHREDVAQHAGDRFGGPITRRPDAAALSDGADSPPVSIPALRMPPT